MAPAVRTISINSTHDDEEHTMTTAQQQYTDFVKQGQEAVAAAVDTWTRSVQDVFGALPTTAPADPAQAVDQVFHFAHKILGAQRDLAQNLVKTAGTAFETAKQAVERTAEQARETVHA
jgi:hypothetical protein